MNRFIPLSVPSLKGNEKLYVMDAIDKEWVSTGGAYIERFENEIAKYLNIGGAVACQSGTAGLHLALLLSGVQKNNEVIVPTLTFIAAVNPIKYLNAYPIFMDCDDTLTMNVHKLEMFFKQECNMIDNHLVNKHTGRIIKAIIIVHVFGNMANMCRIEQLAKLYNLKLIEDATEALGTYYTEGEYGNKYAGTIGDFGVYSFNGNKIITTGGGGMLVAKEKRMLDKAKYFSTQAKDDELNYIHHEIGYNYRMTNIQAAIGVAQLEQLERYIDIKKSNYNLYKKLLSGIEGLKLMEFRLDIRPNYWFYALNIEKEKLNIDKDSTISRLKECGIETRPIWGRDRKSVV